MAASGADCHCSGVGASFVDVVGGKAKRERGEERRETRKHNVGKNTLDHGVYRDGRSDGGRDIRGYVALSREVQRPRRSRLGNVERKRRSGRRESEREENDERVWCLGSLSAVGGGWKEAIVRETEMRI